MIKYSFFIIFFLIISCKEPLGIEKNVDKRVLSEDLFPLEIGNKWHYNDEEFDSNGNIISTSQHSLMVVNTHFTKGKLWFQIENSENTIIEHYYCHTNEGLWYRVPQYFPADEFLILHYPKSENEILRFKDVYMLENNIEIESKFIEKDYALNVADIEFYCYQYNLYRVNMNSNKRTLYKELFYSKGVGLVKENEYREINNNVILTSRKTLNIYNLKN